LQLSIKNFYFLPQKCVIVVVWTAVVFAARVSIALLKGFACAVIVVARPARQVGTFCANVLRRIARLGAVSAVVVCAGVLNRLAHEELIVVVVWVVEVVPVYAQQRRFFTLSKLWCALSSWRCVVCRLDISICISRISTYISRWVYIYFFLNLYIHANELLNEWAVCIIRKTINKIGIYWEIVWGPQMVLVELEKAKKAICGDNTRFWG